MGELVVGAEDCKEIVDEEVGKEEREEKMVLTWEKFLPRMIMRVLLVEFDDSTRQIIAALLRKCSYKVAAVQDGKKAWEVLKEKPLSFDLVLTEVSLPLLSGFGLLTMIVEDPVCKNIPVIMMSSQDSINIVFKCMLQGAADFLVKPLRKNELRNLWQHVWRRRFTSDGANGCQSQNPAEDKFEAVSENNSASNPSRDYVVSVHKKIESTDRGSDTQSSCTRPGEAESINVHMTEEFLLPQMDSGLQKYEGSTKENSNFLASESVAEDKLISQEGEGDTKLSSQAETKMHVQEDCSHARYLPMEENVGTATCIKASLAVNGSNRCNAEWRSPPGEVIDFLGRSGSKLQFSHAQNEYIAVRHDDNVNLREASIRRENESNFECCLPYELSLRRPQLNGYNKQGIEEKNTINHSKASPFLRYSNKSILHGAPASCFSPGPKEGEGECHSRSPTESEHSVPPGNVFSPKPIKWSNVNRSEVSSDGREGEANSHSKGACLSTGIAPEEAAFPCSAFGIMPMPLPVRSFEGLSGRYGTILQPVFYAQQVPPLWSPTSTNKQETDQQRTNPKSDHSLRQSNPEHHHNLGNCDAKPLERQVSNKLDTNLGSNEDDGFASASCQSGSSFCNSGMKYYNLSNSGSVSNNISSADVTEATTKSGNDIYFSTTGVGMLELNRSVQREAALTKFRLKRKERCFEKKVRYQSRKILAEKRPRVKGQFVRQVSYDSSAMQID